MMDEVGGEGLHFNWKSLAEMEGTLGMQNEGRQELREHPPTMTVRFRNGAMERVGMGIELEEKGKV